MKLRTLLLMLTVSLLLIQPAAQAFRFSLGAFGGLNFPIVQEDAKSGSVYGVKARIPVTSFLALEPNFTLLKNGDASQEVEGGWNASMTHEGGKYTTFGLDIAIGSVLGYKGFGVYGIGGISSSKFAKKGIPDLSKSTYWFGLGLEYCFTDQISLDVRGKAMIFPYKDEVTNSGNDVRKSVGTGSRKNGIVTIGLNYYFGIGEE